MSGLFEVSLFAAALVAVVVWCGMSVTSLTPLPASTSPLVRAWRARLWLYAPVWVPVWLLAAAFAPGIWGGLTGRGDHCHTHGGHGHHLCVWHPPHASFEPWVVLFVGVVSVLGLVMMAREAVTLWREWRLARALVRSSVPSEGGIRVLEHREPLALTVGVFHPVILVSQGLLETASARTRRVVLAHERAHVRRRDTARAILDRLFGALAPRRVREVAQRELVLACEQACDREAARAEGEAGEVHVASALLEIARMRMPTPTFGKSAGASSIYARVTHLIGEEEVSTRPLFGAVAGVVALTVAGMGPVHGALERAITFLIH